MGNKASLSPAAFELTQRIQREFPDLGLSDALINEFVGLSKEELAAILIAAFGQSPVRAQKIADVLFEPVGTVNVPATTSKFIADDNFVVDTSRKAKVKISYLGDNFKAWFGNKIEKAFAGSTLAYAKLKKNSVDKPILAELGGDAKAETTLTEVYSLISKQPNGESGDLLTNGWWNIFYVRDINNVLRAVRVRWSGGGWDVRADSVEVTLPWGAGGRVFSRNSVPSES